MNGAGYTLPVFATASVVACLNYLQDNFPCQEVEIDLVNPPEITTISIEQMAKIADNQALAIVRSQPGANLDITRNTPIWAVVKLTPNAETEIIIEGGEGVGKQTKNDNKSAIYSYAQKILNTNILNNLKSNYLVEVKIILPEGKKLAKKTSNEAFGVVEGLSLLGTSGISQPLSSYQQLELYQKELINKAKKYDELVFCIGENGLDLAQKFGFNSSQLVKTANWLGSMLVTAAEAKVKSIILFGYHGKLIKLAGNIFHTHHHLADARLEIMTAIASYLNAPNQLCQSLFTAETTESALEILKEFDQKNQTDYQEKIYQFIVNKIEINSEQYILKHSDFPVKVGAILFNRERKIIAVGNNAEKLSKHNIFGFSTLNMIDKLVENP